MSVERLVKERERILEELASIGTMRRGSIMMQMVETVNRQGRRVRGPYPLYTYKERGRTVSRRLHGEREVSLYRRQIESFRRFEALTDRLRAVGEALCEAEGVSEHEKKRRRSPSSRTGR